MFSGIVKELGEVASVEQRTGSCALGIRSGLFRGLGTECQGRSICVSGVCLTITRVEQGVAFFDLATETRRCTTLGELRVGSVVNLEPALQIGWTLDGHFVQGHVDITAQVIDRRNEDNTVRFEIELPATISRLVAPKGAIAVDGVSLTVGEVTNKSFSVYIIPHTLTITTFGRYQPGSKVNLEADLVARYLERLLPAQFKG